MKLRGDRDSLCWAMGKRLEGQYGKPLAVEAGPILTRMRWKDEERGNGVEYLRIGDVCWLKYRPLSIVADSEV